MTSNITNVIQSWWHRSSRRLQSAVRNVRRKLGLPVADESDQQVVPPQVAILIVVAFALTLGFGILSMGRAPMATVADSTTPVVTMHTYQSSHLPYQLRYPAGWSVEVFAESLPTSQGSFERVIFRRGREVVTFVAATSEQRVTPLFPSLPARIVVDGREALRYQDYDTVTGQPLDRVTLNVGRLSYLMSGSSPVLDRFVASLQILPQP